MLRLRTTSRLVLRTTIARACVLALFAASVAAVTSACQDNYDESPCRNVPANGCPLSHGEACNDPACQAAYACDPDGTWELDHMCPGFDADTDAGAVTDASIDARVDTTVGPVPRDASIDVPPGASGGPGCEALQSPDCTLGFALVCPQGCCGCEDLFVCDNGSWATWGSCDEDAGIVQTN